MKINQMLAVAMLGGALAFASAPTAWAQAPAAAPAAAPAPQTQGIPPSDLAATEGAAPQAAAPDAAPADDAGAPADKTVQLANTGGEPELMTLAGLALASGAFFFRRKLA